MFERYAVTLQFENRVCGSVPLSKELVPIWLKSRMPKNKPEGEPDMEAVEQEVMDSIQETEERTTLGFQLHEDVLVVRGGTIKAHLKDCSNQIKDVVPNPKPVKSEAKKGIKALRSKVANMVYVEEYWVSLLRDDGEPVREEDSSYEQPVHVMTPMGPRNALKVIRFVEKPVMRFTLRVLENRQVTADTIRAILEYGSIHGYGGERGMGEGRYSFTMEKVS